MSGGSEAMKMFHVSIGPLVCCFCCFCCLCCFFFSLWLYNNTPQLDLREFCILRRELLSSEFGLALKIRYSQPKVPAVEWDFPNKGPGARAGHFLSSLVFTPTIQKIRRRALRTLFSDKSLHNSLLVLLDGNEEARLHLSHSKLPP